MSAEAEKRALTEPHEAPSTRGDAADPRGFSAHGKDDRVAAMLRRAYAAQAVKQRDHVSAGLLAIFLGVFGMHKFYLGYNQAAFAMLAVSIVGGIVTLGLAAAVMWVIAIIEGVIYLSKSQTTFDREYVMARRDWF